MSAHLVQKALDPERVRVGATLRAFREKSGLRIGQVGDALRPPLSYSYLSNIEAGRKPLTPVLLAQLAALYGVPQYAVVRPDLIAGDDAAVAS